MEKLTSCGASEGEPQPSTDYKVVTKTPEFIAP